MNKKKVIRTLLIIVVAGVLIILGTIYYLFNKPHRDVAEMDVDFTTSATELVTEYLNAPDLSNEKYLAEDGESKILAVTGMVASINTDLNNQRVVTLRDESQKAGVSCTFTLSTNTQTEKVSLGQTITVKGVIRSGAEHNEDLDLYEDVIMEKCSIKNQH